MKDDIYFSIWYYLLFKFKWKTLPKKERLSSFFFFLSVKYSLPQKLLLKVHQPYQDCFCDVSNSCDQQCCCDQDCSASVATYWSDYNICANDGFNIPFCSSIISSPLHIHDLSEGLRLIYTVWNSQFRSSKEFFASRESILQLQVHSIQQHQQIKKYLSWVEASQL